MLDYNIVTAVDRCASLNSAKIDPNTTAYQLEQMANYILYGKDEEGKALPEAKTNNSKKSTFKKTQPHSLEELIEHPTFDETSIMPEIKRNCYLASKPTISRVSDGDIPNMQELWRGIDELDAVFREETDPLKKYYLRHWIIDLRKEQYYLKDIFKPTIHFLAPIHPFPYETDWNADCGYAVEPLHLVPKTMPNGKEYWVYDGPADWTWRELASHTIDLSNPTHIYHLLDNYSAIYTQYYAKDPFSTLLCIYRALEKLIDRAHLTPVRYYILTRKVDGALNEQIAQEVFQKFGVSYGVNYISTIWTKEICAQIANTYLLVLDEEKVADKPEKWKRCKKCGQLKLRDPREFPRKAKYPDKLAPICRECS